MNERNRVTEIAESYYDSSDADAFYLHVWGGEDIHIGIYERPDDTIFEASRRSVQAVAQRVTVQPGDHILDLGSGYGGTARWLVREYDCKVTCLNLSEVQNQRNRALNDAAGLSDRIEVVHGSFEDLSFPADAFEHAFSQDAFLHSGDKRQVLAEAFRVLKPNGHLVFSDPMQADDVTTAVLQPVLDRIHLDHLGSFASYRALAEATGFEVVGMEDLTHQLPRHYAKVRSELEARRSELEGRTVAQDYLERMLIGLSHWVRAGEAGHLAWGIIDLKRPR